ncbi:MAG: YceI family protein [Bacteroidetes bacterium]|nr:MAG: YceI family protein [Bacteroidota bacterium]PTM14366.1 MAG: YceI family protein [Bacteroidota bacterium]
MKQLSLIFFALAALTLAFTAPVDAVSVDTNNSVVTWKGYKVLGFHTGTLKLTKGELQMQDGVLVGGSFLLNMGTINCTDLEGAGKGKLEGHLKSADFFGVEKFPTAAFQITQVVSRGTPGSYKVTGNLTIKETTKPIRFNVQIAQEKGQQVATGEVTIDRSDFDVRYGSGSFFDSLGDNTIYDEFDLAIRLVLNK